MFGTIFESKINKKRLMPKNCITLKHFMPYENASNYPDCPAFGTNPQHMG